MLGPTRLGCFEIPDCEKEPTSNIDCPECVTVSKQNTGVPRRAFVMGHRLQFKG